MLIHEIIDTNHPPPQTTSSHLFVLVRSTLDKTREIDDRKLEREVKRRQHDGEEDVPPKHIRHERQRSGSQDLLLRERRITLVVLSQVPESRGKERESRHKG